MGEKVEGVQARHGFEDPQCNEEAVGEVESYEEGLCQECEAFPSLQAY